MRFGVGMMTFNGTHRLIKKADLFALRRELDAGLDPNLSNKFSWSLLMLAALEGDTSIGELLISRGASLGATNDVGETALSLAAHNGHTRFVQLLLANGAPRNCRPHGHSLADWIRVASGLPQDKIDAVLELIG